MWGRLGEVLEGLWNLEGTQLEDGSGVSPYPAVWPWVGPSLSLVKASSETQEDDRETCGL